MDGWPWVGFMDGWMDIANIPSIGVEKLDSLCIAFGKPEITFEKRKIK